MTGKIESLCTDDRERNACRIGKSGEQGRCRDAGLVISDLTFFRFAV